MGMFSGPMGCNTYTHGSGRIRSYSMHDWVARLKSANTTTAYSS